MSTARLSAVLALPLVLAGAAAAQTTTRVSVGSGGAQANGPSGFPSLSADGRFVAFESRATNLVAGDTNGVQDIFVEDLQSGTCELVSRASSGALGDDDSERAALSADGRFVAFESSATNLVPGDTNGLMDIFVRDRLLGTTERVSVSTSGAQQNQYCIYPAISADGRCVAFPSYATNLVAGDTNGVLDIFVRDLAAGTTERASVASSGAQGNGDSAIPWFSADGRYLSFFSGASNLVAGDTNAADDVFVHDRWSGTTERVSVSSAGAQGDDASRSALISADGRFVAFLSLATTLVPGDTNGRADVFLRDRQLGTTERVSISSAGAQGNFDSWWPSLPADGSRVAFASYASTLVPGDTNANDDVFFRDLRSGTTERVSVSSSGAQADYGGDAPSISASGRYIAFQSSANNLVAGDTNGTEDVFVRDTGALPTGTDLCQAGTNGVQACPCSNPPGGSARGCDNSSATGGARLVASGSASLSSDTLLLATSGEIANAVSIVLQGDLELPAGIVFGQGLRCAGGNLRRLYTKLASNGAISVPQAADPSVSQQARNLGDTLGAVALRWYAVYYHDPSVLGGCPVWSGFNATQTVRVTWTP